VQCTRAHQGIGADIWSTQGVEHRAGNREEMGALWKSRECLSQLQRCCVSSAVASQWWLFQLLAACIEPVRGSKCLLFRFTPATCLKLLRLPVLALLVDRLERDRSACGDQMPTWGARGREGCLKRMCHPRGKGDRPCLPPLQHDMFS